MTEGNPARGAPLRVTAEDVVDDHNDLITALHRLEAVVRQLDAELQKLISNGRPTWPDISMAWQVGHDMIGQCQTELNAVRQRMALRLRRVTSVLPTL